MKTRKSRRLSASEKYELFIAVLTGQSTQREAADRYRVDRSTVLHIVKTAKQGALGALAASVPGRDEPGAGRAAGRPRRGRPPARHGAEQAVALHLHEGKARWD